MALSRCINLYSLENAVNKAVNKLGFSLVKPQQMMASNEFINGRDVFVVLPTAINFYLTNQSNLPIIS